MRIPLAFRSILFVTLSVLGFFHIILGYKLGMCKAYSIAILAFYGMAGVIRLAYFNVMEAKRQSETSENRKYYQGLPQSPS